MEHMTRIAKLIDRTRQFGEQRLWYRNHHENQNYPINSNIINLINTVIHDYTNVIKKYKTHGWELTNATINHNEFVPWNVWWLTIRGDSRYGYYLN